MRPWLAGVLCLFAVHAFAQTNDAALSEMERDASYCYGVAAGRYANYVSECRDKEGCNLLKGMRTAAATHEAIAVYLRQQGLLAEGARPDAAKAEQSKAQRRGTEDYRACADYADRMVHGCIVYCLGRPNEGRCLKDCHETRGDAQACERLQPCSDPFSPIPAK